ncbi:hypothetical protein FRC02_003799 [Tulasnella sp. 418]|nr:hypothetical protein FRC02_003799 [Tulasnella sp. 418]
MARLRITLDPFIDLLAPLAKSIQNLESSFSTVADIFLHWTAIIATLKKLLDDNALSSDPDFDTETCSSIIQIINRRSREMLDEAPTDIYLAGFLLDPVVRNSQILRGTARVSVVVNNIPREDDGETVICVRKQLLQMLRSHLDSRGISGGKKVAANLIKQLSLYVRSYPPFNIPISPKTLAIDWWRSLADVPEASIIATYAIKIFSAFPTSMADERTASTMGWLNSPRRNRMKASTIVANAQVREYFRATLGIEDLPKPSRIRVDFHGIDHNQVERKLTARDIKRITDELAEVPAGIMEFYHYDLTGMSVKETNTDLTADYLSTITDDIQGLAATPASAEDINEMTQVKPTDHKDCTSPQDEEFDSCFTFSIEDVVKLDHKYLLTLFSGGKLRAQAQCKWCQLP